MALRVLHVGNIATNAYNIAKALRQRTDVEADVFTRDYRYYISEPEWEDADIEPVQFADLSAPDWSTVDLKGFQRPAWFMQRLDAATRRRLRTLPAKDLLRVVEDRLIDGDAAGPVRQLLNEGRQGEIPAERLCDLYDGLAASLPTTPTAQDWHRRVMAKYRQILDDSFAPLEESGIVEQVQGKGYLAALFNRYDIIQTYGVDQPMWPLLFAPAIPRVTFEHGSMREHPFAGGTMGNLLALAYKTSFRNIITNADAIHAIRRLGLNNCTFIPHPVDDEKFRPIDSPLRARLLQEHGCRQIVFAVARHNWAIKGNDKVIHGFAQLQRRLGRGAKLFLADWGQEMEQSRALVRELKLDDDVVWLPPLPKRRLAEYINASDVVLDQFMLGCFGTTTPEAMACAKPVLLHYNREDHDWCFSEHPPVLAAESAAEIAAALERVLTGPEEAAEIGRRSREWFLRHHSLDLVVQRHMEIYRAIEGSPAVVCIPKEFAVRKESARPARPADVAAVVRISGPLVIDGQPTALRDLCGAPRIRILADRLRKVPQIRRTVLVLNATEPRTIAAAKKLGWSVLVTSKRRAEDAATLFRLARCKRAALFSLDSPFVDPETTASLLDESDGVSVLRLMEGCEFGPSLVATRRFAAQVALLRLMLRGRIGWRRAFDALVPLTPRRDVRLGVEEVAKLVQTDAASVATAEVLGGPDFTLRQLQERAAGRDFGRQLALALRKRLHAETLHAPDPVAINQRLNDLECDLGCDELLSFPTFVGLNMTSVCSARCVFCSYQPSMLKERDHITVEDLKKMTWLRHVGGLAAWGGVGDSLMNPEFLDCLRYLKAAHPHLAIDLWTNGIRMTRELGDEFAEHLSQYNVSLNAARKETWEKLMRTKGFDNVCETFAHLARRRRESGARKPLLSLSMVLTRTNVAEAVEFVELAARLGADRATYAHYLSTTLIGRRDLAPEESLYHEKEKADDWLEKAAARGAELGLEVARPLPFAAELPRIEHGARTARAPQPCSDPWKTCYLTVDEEGRRQMIFCCSGFYYGVKYDKSDMSEENFCKAWNHPAARYFRRTVNKKGANPICAYCQSVDRFDPENNRRYYEIGAKAAAMFQSMDRNVVFFRLPGQELPKEPQPCRQDAIRESSSSAT